MQSCDIPLSCCLSWAVKVFNLKTKLKLKLKLTAKIRLPKIHHKSCSLRHTVCRIHDASPNNLNMVTSIDFEFARDVERENFPHRDTILSHPFGNNCCADLSFSNFYLGFVSGFGLAKPRGRGWPSKLDHGSATMQPHSKPPNQNGRHCSASLVVILNPLLMPEMK